MKSVSKGAFLDMLKGTNANVSIEAENEVKTVIRISRIFVLITVPSCLLDV